MHEMGIAESVVGAVRVEAARHAGARVARVGLRIGELAGVDRESLSFCFEVLVEGTELECAALAIESTPRDELEIAWLELEEPDGTNPAGA
jgi:hydrogenase nickel incorporation protein HypA/HybF